MTDNHINIHVGAGLNDFAKRVAEAWHSAERGEDVHERHITFVSWDLLSKTLTKKRYELLGYVHSHPDRNIAELARETKRDYKRVYEDVHALELAGLLSRQGNHLRADYNRIDSSITFP